MVGLDGLRFLLAVSLLRRRIYCLKQGHILLKSLGRLSMNFPYGKRYFFRQVKVATIAIKRFGSILGSLVALIKSRLVFVSLLSKMASWVRTSLAVNFVASICRSGANASRMYLRNVRGGIFNLWIVSKGV
jgi:hypothetical protein